MTRYLIVPNDLHDAIHAAIMRQAPDIPDADRDICYHKLLAFFDEHGRLPEFTLVKKEEDPCRTT